MIAVWVLHGQIMACKRLHFHLTATYVDLFNVAVVARHDKLFQDRIGGIFLFDHGHDTMLVPTNKQRVELLTNPEVPNFPLKAADPRAAESCKVEDLGDR